MAEWHTESVAECLAPLRTRSPQTIQTREYRRAGRYPIVDQGQARIAGWTDDDAGLIRDDLPLVVFGDHTRALKFIDFPFVRGADGTQLLKPRADIDPLFFYYALLALDLPSRGYNRHFKALKAKQIKLTGPADQQEIIRVLRRIEEAIDLQDEQLASWSDCRRTASSHLFSRGLSSELCRETDIGSIPEKWTVTSLESCIEPPTYGYTASARSEPIGPKLLRITDIRESGVDWATVPYCTCDEVSRRDKRLRHGDIVVARIGATTGKSFLLKEPPEAVFASYLIRLRTEKTKLLAPFLYHWMQSERYWEHINQNKGGRLKSGVNIPILTSLRLPLPSIPEQTEIIRVLDSIDEKIDLHRRKRTILVGVFRSLLQPLVTGGIDIADIDVSALGEMRLAEAAE